MSVTLELVWEAHTLLRGYAASLTHDIVIGRLLPSERDYASLRALREFVAKRDRGAWFRTDVKDESRVTGFAFMAGGLLDDLLGWSETPDGRNAEEELTDSIQCLFKDVKERAKAILNETPGRGRGRAEWEASQRRRAGLQ